MIFYILSPHKLNEIDCRQEDFIPDAVMFAIQSAKNKVATNEESFVVLSRAYPKFHKYKIEIGKV